MDKSIQKTAFECPPHRPGLCETCLHTVRSVVTARRGSDPLCLEVLDNCRAGLDDGHGFDDGADAASVGRPDTTAAPRPKPIGLCANCALDETCTRPRPESGVWHCEDYS